MTAQVARQPKGVPIGGEYAATARPEPALELDRLFAGHSPRQVDELCADLYDRLGKAKQAVERQVDYAHHRLGHNRGYGRGLRWGGWPSSTEQVLADLAQALADDKVVPYEVKPARAVLAKAEEAAAECAEINTQIDEMQAEYVARGRWSRFFLVTSSAGGHIHSSMSCHTCRFDTSFGWLPELSGKTEPDAVADQGAILCTACYPSAPLDWTRGKVDLDVCPGSNKGAANDETWRSGRSRGGACSVCGEVQTVGYNGVRKHKTPKAK
jgi:hypothetical protein